MFHLNLFSLKTFRFNSEPRSSTEYLNVYIVNNFRGKYKIANFF